MPPRGVKSERAHLRLAAQRLLLLIEEGPRRLRPGRVLMTCVRATQLGNVVSDGRALRM